MQRDETQEGAYYKKEFKQMMDVCNHSLRDPLRIVDGVCEEAKSNGQELNSEGIAAVQKHIHEVLNKIDLLRKYISMHGAGNYEDVDLQEVYQSVKNDLNELVVASGAQISCDPLPTIQANKDQVTMAMHALVENALRFRQPEQKPQIHVAVGETPDEWVLSVRDNGSGMDEIYAPIVFGMFQRLNPEAEDASFGGGLALVKAIAFNHHGKAWFKSEEDEGCETFVSFAKNLS